MKVNQNLPGFLSTEFDSSLQEKKFRKVKEE